MEGKEDKLTVSILSGIPVPSGALGCQRTIRARSSMKSVIYLVPGVVSTINYLFNCVSNFCLILWYSDKQILKSDSGYYNQA